MITFSMLGKHGRLGNQMFQYSMTKSVAKKNNFLFAIPKSDHELFNCFNIKTKVYDLEKNVNTLQKLKLYREKSFNYDDNVFSLGDNINYVGNYQSEKYFIDIEDEIKKDFSFKEEIVNEAKSIFDLLPSNKIKVFVHIRRGDYLNLSDYHPVCSLEYYKKAFHTFEDCIFLCFSDDIEWCKNNLKNYDNIHFIQSSNAYVDLCLMTMCDHGIIANSSFSWWGAWLCQNESKKIIAPKNWFGPKYSQHNLDDLYCKDWIVI